MLVDDAQHVAARERHVSGVEQQRQRLARMGHQKIEFRFGLDRRGHVVMIGDRHALAGAPFGESGHLMAVDFYLVIRELRLGRQRLGAVALDGAGGLAIDDARRLGRDEEIQLGADAILLSLDVSVEQQAGEPAAADRDAMASQDRPEFVHVHREAPARLHAGESGDARLPEAFLEADVVGEFGEVVVPPGDGRYSKFGFHVGHTPMRCLARICSCCARALRTDSSAETSGTPTSQSASPGTQA